MGTIVAVVHALTMRYSLHLTVPAGFQRRSIFQLGANSNSISQRRLERLSVKDSFAQSICVCQSFLSNVNMRCLWSVSFKSSFAKNVFIRVSRLILITPLELQVLHDVPTIQRRRTLHALAMSHQ